jgi:glucose/arabinose dehydrogenase
VGSWTNAGVQWAPVDPTTHRPTRPTEFFARGFGRRNAGGNDQRVSDLVFARDGRMFFADDQSGDIYWVAPTTLRMPAR